MSAFSGMFSKNQNGDSLISGNFVREMDKLSPSYLEFMR